MNKVLNYTMEVTVKEIKIILFFIEIRFNKCILYKNVIWMHYDERTIKKLYTFN
jgi:hypothetical protein